MQGPAEDKTLSPYFVVKSDDPSVDALPLKHTGAQVSIAGVIADVKVTQVYRNAGKRPIEAIYVFPASTRAAVYALKMTIGARTIVAKIEKKEQARERYEQAKAAGKSASLLEQQRPNVFQMSVANILPGDEIKVELSYTELLIPTEGVYELVYPTVVGPRYTSKPEAGAAPSERWVKNPYLHQGESPPYTFDIRVRLAAGMPIQEMSSTSHKIDIKYTGTSDAVVTLDPSESQGGNRDFILKYRLAGGKIASGLLLYPGQDENFFLLMMQPPQRVTASRIPPREYIFVVDVSGSMWGFPLDITKKLLRDLISRLRPTDRFNVVLFAGAFATLADAAVPASADNIAKALALIEGQLGGGGTELLPALRHAFGLPRPEGFARTVVVATDGFVAAEPEVFDLIRSNLDNTGVFAFGIGTSVNRHLIEGMAHVGMGEPFVITSLEEAPAQAARFREYIEAPVLSGVHVDFGAFEAYDVEPPAVPDVLAQRPVIVFGKWRGAPHGTISVRGLTGEGPYRAQIDAGAVKPDPANSALRYLWARHRIALLGDYQGLRPSSETVQKITDLGLKYNLLTHYTSFVAIDSIVRSQGGRPEVVKQPLPLPQGVSDFAVGEQAPSAPLRMRGVAPVGDEAGGAQLSGNAPVIGVAKDVATLAAGKENKGGTSVGAIHGHAMQRHMKGPGQSAGPIESIAVNGGSDRQAIEQAIRARSYDLDWCGKAVQAGGISAEIAIRIVFSSDGKVMAVHIKGATVPKGLEDCLKTRLRAWTIPAFATGAKPVEIKLRARLKA